MRDILAACLLLCVACAEAPAPAPAPAKMARNVLIVYVDTLRADHLGAYGYAQPTSPRIDRLAAEGVRFGRAHAASPWTYSSTASLVTGLYPAAHGAIIPGVEKKVLNRAPVIAELAPGFETLAERFAAAGFHTALFARNVYLGHGNEQGFSSFVNSAQSSAENQVRLSLDWVNALPQDARFLLQVHFIDVHGPNRPTAASRKAFPLLDLLGEDELKAAGRRPKGDPGDDAPLTPEFKAQRVALYDASIRDVDSAVDTLLLGLGSRLKDTLVIFTADHGEEFWDHEELERSLYSDERGVWGVSHGHTMFDELVRVPLIVSMPGAIAAATIDTPVSLVDVLPTLLDCMALPPASNIDGRSLRPLLEGRSLPERPMLYDSVCHGRDKQGIRIGRWKFVRSDSEPDLLLDLQADPRETRNVAGEHPEEVARLASALEAALAESRARGDALRQADSSVREMLPEEIEDLAELGYIR